MSADAARGDEPAAADQPEAEFLAGLQSVAENWRYSDEFIGIMVRNHWPRRYNRG